MPQPNFAGKKSLIQPKHIPVKRHFWDAFGNCETETSARLIVKFCRAKGGWVQIIKKELDEFTKQDFWFNRLVPKYVIEVAPGKYRVTEEFVAKCYAATR